jgi:hypothetical protein
MKKILILLLLIGIGAQSSFYYSPAGLTIEALAEGATLYQDIKDGLGAAVTKDAYTKLLSEKTALDIERQRLKKELLDTRTEKDKKIAEQKNRITTLRQEIMELQSKFEYDMKVAKEKQEELTRSLQVLWEQSSEETKILLKQIEKLREKYERCKKAKNEEIDALKAGHRVETLSLVQKKTAERLFHQLEQALREEIEKGEIRVKLYKTKIK